MFGWATALSTRCRALIVTATRCALAVFSVILVPSNRMTVRPSSFFSRSDMSAAMRSTSGGAASSASCSVNARLSVTACAASVAFRWRLRASVRA